MTKVSPWIACLLLGEVCYDYKLFRLTVEHQLHYPHLLITVKKELCGDRDSTYSSLTYSSGRRVWPMVSVFHHLVYLFLLVCVCTAVCVPMEDRRACPFDAELHVAVRCLMWVLKAELGVCMRETSALRCWAPFLTLGVLIKTQKHFIFLSL